MTMTAAVASQADAKPRKHKRPQFMRMTATAYCTDGETKSGERTADGVIAADPRVLPVGSVVRIDIPESRHSKVYAVLDTGPAVKGNHVDIFMPDCHAAKQFGRRPVLVKVIEVQRPPEVARNE
jgi:3D (Asp-Asp-Asp) domain-containing protein